LATFTLAMSGLVGLQGLFGITLALMGDRPADGDTHFVVGPLTLFVLPVARRLGARQSERAAAAILAVAWFALMLLALRAVGSGGGLSG
jgi:hypothetical protein